MAKKGKMEKRNCLECGDPYDGRKDKKFCCDQCRTSYFNKQNTDFNRFISESTAKVNHSMDDILKKVKQKKLDNQ